MICPYCQQETGHFAKHAWPDGCAKAVMSPPTPPPSQTLAEDIRSVQRFLGGIRQTETVSETISSLQRDLETRRLGASLYDTTWELPRNTLRYTATRATESVGASPPSLDAWATFRSCVAAFNAQQYNNGWSALAVQRIEYDRFDLTVSYNPPAVAARFSATQSTTREIFHSNVSDLDIHNHVQRQLEYCITQVRQAVIDRYSLCNHPNRWTCFVAPEQTQEDRELLIENYLARFNLAQIVAASSAFRNRYNARIIHPSALYPEEEGERSIRVIYYDALSHPTHGSIPIPTSLLHNTTTIPVISSEVRTLLHRVITKIRQLANTPAATPW